MAEMVALGVRVMALASFLAMVAQPRMPKRTVSFSVILWVVRYCQKN